MFIDTATTDAPIARMRCPSVLMLAYLEDEVVASYPTEYQARARKAYNGLPDSDRDMEVMQLMSLRDHLSRLIERVDSEPIGDTFCSAALADCRRLHRDLFWRTRVIALSDQARGVSA